MSEFPLGCQREYPLSIRRPLSTDTGPQLPVALFQFPHALLNGKSKQVIKVDSS